MDLPVHATFSSPQSGKRKATSSDKHVCVVCDKHDIDCEPTEDGVYKLIACIDRRAELCDPEYITIKRQLIETQANAIKIGYHRRCYQKTTNKEHISRLENKIRKDAPASQSTSPSSVSCQQDICGDIGPTTRSTVTPFDKTLCFFCQLDVQNEKIHECLTVAMGQNIRDCIVGNQVLEIRMNSSIDETDARAIDVKYHLKCYVSECRSKISREKEHDTTRELRIQSAEHEVVSIIDSYISDGNVLAMSDCDTIYRDTLSEYGIDVSEIRKRNRPHVKRLITESIPHATVLHKVGTNLSTVSSTKIGPEIMHSATTNTNTALLTITKAAEILRQNILEFDHPIDVAGSIVPTVNDVPPLMYMFCKLLIAGGKQQCLTEKRQHTINASAVTLSLNICYATKSDKQISHKPKDQSTGFRSRDDENIQVLATGLAIRKYCRSSFIVNFLHKLNVSLPNTRLLQIETGMANSIIRTLDQHPSGITLIDFLEKKQFVYFHMDNCDFAIDTNDGQCQLHGALIVLFQRKVKETRTYNLVNLDNTSRTYTIDPIPFTEIRDCDKPNVKKNFKIPNGINIPVESNHQRVAHIQDEIIPWQFIKGDTKLQHSIPALSGYQSLVQNIPEYVTNIAPLPILPRPVSEWSTLYTALKIAQGISVETIGAHRMTTISLDLALYEKCVQLSESCRELQSKYNLRLGELHVVKAHLACLGNFILGSGYDSVWAESNVYGPTTTKSILTAGHISRAIQAHEDNLIALTQIMVEQLYNENPDVKDEIHALMSGVSYNDSVYFKSAHDKLKDIPFRAQLEAFIHNRGANFNNMFAIKYMEMISRCQNYIYATRNRDWLGHLETSAELCKDFFSQDRIKYMRMMPYYIKSQYRLQEKDPETWKALSDGDFCVTKSPLPYVSIGVDHAGEQENKVLKINGGITGIANNLNARNRYCITAPVISRMVREWQDKFQISCGVTQKHHQLLPSKLIKQNERVTKIKSTVEKHIRLFSDDTNTELCSIITNKVIPHIFAENILKVDFVGEELYSKFVEERLETQSCPFWNKLSRNNLPSFSKPNPKAKSPSEFGNINHLKEERDLLARFIIISRSSCTIDEQEAIGNYEFSSFPRSLFAEGSLRMCTDKSEIARHFHSITQNAFRMSLCTLDENEAETDKEWSSESDSMSIDSLQEEDISNNCIEELPLLFSDQHGFQSDFDTNVQHSRGIDSCTSAQNKCVIIDGMAVLHLVPNSKILNSIDELADVFNSIIEYKIEHYDQVRLVFDPYLDHSRKTATRVNRNKHRDAIYYKINEHTSLQNKPLSHFLGHEKTKQELSIYLGNKFLETFKDKLCVYVTIYGGNDLSVTHSNVSGIVKKVSHLDMNHDEADTMIIAHAIDFATSASQLDILHIWSPDTDILLLLLYFFPKLLTNTFLFWQENVFDICGLCSFLGKEKAQGILAWHAITGCDTTGRLSGKGKKSWLNLYLDLEPSDNDNTMLKSFAEFGLNEDLHDELISPIERFIAIGYDKHTENLPAARWHLFSKKMVDGDRLPPTPNAFKLHLLRAFVQTHAWCHAYVPSIPHLDVMSGHFGWSWDGDCWIPIPLTIGPAPVAVLALVKCNCHGKCGTKSCTCYKQGFRCTEMCHLSAENACENTESPDIHGIDSGEEDDE